MRKRQAGQAFILVLILLAIGALVIIPALRLTFTGLKSSQIVTRQIKALYAAEAAQEYIIWKLVYDDFASEFTYDGQSANFTFDCCGSLVDILVIMRAVEAVGGTCLTGDDVIRPTKTVDPDAVDSNIDQTYTYTINLEQISDNTSQGLDAIYDILPSGFGPSISAYQDDSSKLSLDGGVTWLDVPEPHVFYDEGHLVLKWPADYDWETEIGAFSSDNSSPNYFHGIRDFTPGQVKQLKFEVRDELKAGVYCNWVVLKPWNTLSGATAPITVGSTADNTCKIGMLEVDKMADPELVLPGVSTPIEYTISITNKDTSTRQIEEIVDYLPPAFYYTDGTTSGNITDTDGTTSDVTIDEPRKDVKYVCGADRQVLRWETFKSGEETLALHSGYTLTLTFWAQTTTEVSGTYYDEVFVFTDSDADLRQVFVNIGVTAEEFGSTYSWNAGKVIVPTYDSQTDAGTVIINSNMSLLIGDAIINSWEVE